MKKQRLLIFIYVFLLMTLALCFVMLSKRPDFMAYAADGTLGEAKTEAGSETESGSNANKSNGKEVLTVGVPVDRCPIFYIDVDSNEIVGIGADLMRYVGEEAGYEVVLRQVEEGNLKDALDNSAYDVILPFGSAITSTSGHNSVVTENLFQTPFTLVTLKQDEVPPLDSLKVGMLKSLGGGADTVRQLYPGIEITMYDTMADCVKALRDDKVDALLHNSYVWSYVLQKPSYSDLEVQPEAMFSMDFRAGVRDTVNGREVVERLNAGISKLADTRRQAVILDYTSRDLYRYDLSDFLYRYGISILLVFLLFIALIIIAIQRVRAVRRENERKLQQMINQDHLTGALSMTGFRKKAAQLVHDNPDTPYLLAFVNIKNFKFINDSLGRHAGDDLLRFWVAETMKTLSDREAMGRVGADHFVVLRICGGEDRLRRDDEEVIGSVRNYFLDRGKENLVLVSGGIYVLTSEDYRHVDVDHMMDLASMAERKIRDKQGDGYEFYNPDQWDKGKHVADVISQLPKALKEGEIQVWYQPQVDYATGEITGGEALCRWKHGKIGWIPPGSFIPILEDAGMIYDLDHYVWETACKDLKRWIDMGIRRSVSVNVSRCDIREDRDLPKLFLEMVKRYDVPPELFHIEITETAYADNSEMLIRTTERLRELGFQVEMDDFGSGYSSLHMLKEVPVDRIKLDLRFLTDTGDQEKGRIIIGYMIRMVDSLGMKIITEGVETKEQADFLRSQGSTEMQGYFFYKPMPVIEFEDLGSK